MCLLTKTPLSVEEEAVATEVEVAKEADNEEDECPLNAHVTKDGRQCDFGFDVNEESAGCRGRSRALTSP